MTLIVTDLERTDLERTVSVSSPPPGPLSRPLHHGTETLFAARFIGKCGCGRHVSAIVWKIESRYAPVKRKRDPQFAGIPATEFQDPGVRVPTARRPVVDCGSCGEAVALKEVHGKTKADHVCDVRCTSARGRSCECSCGGLNHGRDWS